MSPERTPSAARLARIPRCCRGLLLTVSVTGSLLLAGGCSKEVEAGASGTEPVRAERERPKLAPSQPRSMSAAAVRLRDAIDTGRLVDALELLPGVRDTLGVEGTLLTARVRALEGRHVDSGALIEEARKAAPNDPRVYATAAELHGAAGRFETAWREVRLGEEVCGDDAPEIVRARGVIWICREGGAREGVELLEDAFASDASLPFLARPMGQGYLLLAKSALAEGQARLALTYVERSLEHDPVDIDARRLAADVRAGLGDFHGAIGLLEKLFVDGEPVQSELALMHKRSGMAALIGSDRQSALFAFREARRLGLTDAELGTGAQVLADEADELIQLGIEAFQARKLESAVIKFELALKYDPDHLEARNHLGVALYQLDQLEPAIEAWREVVRTAWDEDIELPDPVHINLATALLRSGDEAGARDILQAYLVHAPEGPWSAPTRERLAQLTEDKR